MQIWKSPEKTYCVKIELQYAIFSLFMKKMHKLFVFIIICMVFGEKKAF